MIELARWRPADLLDDRPWLLLGKGPTFARRAEHDLSSYVTVSLNHAVLEQPVDIAHILDWDVVEACVAALPTQCRYLLLPWHPNIDFKPAVSTAEELLALHPGLREMAREGRVVVYRRLGVDPEPGPLVDVRFFSAEAALDVIGHLGVRRVRTLGIDGGTAYAGEFDRLADATRLANGQPSFSRQTQRLREIARRHGMEVKPLVEPLRIFIGVDESQLLAAEVLEHTIRKHATRPVEVTPLLDVPTPMPKDPRNQPRTAFSFSRFHIPALCDYQGRALYLDADMQVFGDISELWEVDFDGAKVLCTYQRMEDTPEQWRGSSHFHPGRQMSVMMLDCAALPWRGDEVVSGLDEGRYTYEQLMFELCLVAPDEIRDTLPPVWNHLEHYEPGSTRLLHYTVVPTQPWKNDQNPLRHLWEAAFAEAWQDRVIERDLLARQVKGKHVKKSLRALAPTLPEPAPRGPVNGLEVELRATRGRLAAAERPVGGRVRDLARELRTRLR